MKSVIETFILRGHSRSIAAKKNVFGLFVIKGMNICINLSLVPLIIGYVNPTKYGVWLTLSSIVGWLTFFDIGFTQALRNKFAETKAKNKITLAKIYISTTYAVLSIMFSVLFFSFLIINKYIKWFRILNTTKELSGELTRIAVVVFGMFFLQMVLRTVHTIVVADQKPAKAASFDLFGLIITYLFIFLLTKTTDGSLYLLSIAYSVAPVFALIVSSIYFYSKDYKKYKPAFKLIDFCYARDLVNIGGMFFLIQISTIVIYQTNNIIIAQLFGPYEVAAYNIAYKYLGILFMFFSLLISPFWSAFTDAYSQNDFTWMKESYNKLKYISWILPVVALILISLSGIVYKFWIKDSVIIPFSVTTILGTYFVIQSWAYLNAQILNGIGKITLQLILNIVAMILHIPLALYLGKYTGIIGVVMSSTIICVLIYMVTTKQVSLILEEKSYGIWNV